MIVVVCLTPSGSWMLVVMCYTNPPPHSTSIGRATCASVMQGHHQRTKLLFMVLKDAELLYQPRFFPSCFNQILGRIRPEQSKSTPGPPLVHKPGASAEEDTEDNVEDDANVEGVEEGDGKEVASAS